MEFNNLKRPHLPVVTMFIVLFPLLISCTTSPWLKDNYKPTQGDVEVFLQRCHSNAVWAPPVYSTNDNRLITGSFDGTIKIWDLDKSRLIRTININAPVFSLACTTDDKFIIAGLEDGTIKFINAQNGKETRTIKGKHKNRVSSLVIDTDVLFSCSWDGTVQAWNLQNGKKLWEHNNITREGRYYIHPWIDYRFCALAHNPKEKELAAGLLGGDVYIFDTVTGKKLKTLSMEMLTFLTYSPDGKCLVSVGINESNNNTFIRIWNVKTGEIITEKIMNTDDYGAIMGVRYSPSGEQITIVTYGFSVITWNSDLSTILWEKKSYLGYLQSLTYSLSGDTIFVTAMDGSVGLLDAHTGEERGWLAGKQGVLTEDGASRVESIAVTPDGEFILSASKNPQIWDIKYGMLSESLQGHTKNVIHIESNPHNPYFISTSVDEVIAWDSQKNNILKSSPFLGAPDFVPDRLQLNIPSLRIEHTNTIASIVYNPSGKYFVAGLNNGSIMISDPELINIHYYAIGHSAMIRALAFSPNGDYLASASDDGTIRIFDVRDMENWKLFKILPVPVSNNYELRSSSIKSDIWKNTVFVTWSINFSPDGSRLISGAEDGFVRIYDINSGRIIKTLKGHTVNVTSVVYSSDGKLIFSGSGDMTIKIWNAENGKLKHTINNNDIVTAIVLNPQNKQQIISASKNNGIRIWDIVTGKEIAAFISFADDHWIVITPDGYYNSSSKGDQYLNVRIGNEVYGMDQFAKTFYQPEVVENRLQGLPVSDKIKPGVSIQTITSIPPAITITSGNVDPVTRKVNLSIKARGPFRQINEVEIIVNGRLVGSEELQAVTFDNTEVTLTPGHTRLVASSAEKQYEFTIPIQLDPGYNRIEVIADNIADNDFNFGIGYLDLYAPQTETHQNGTLWVLAIGVNNYVNDTDYNLKFAADDAKRISDYFKTQKDIRFDNVCTRLVTDVDEPNMTTKQNIIDNLSFLKNAGPNDTVVFFVSAHGKTENGMYYFYPSDIKINKDGTFNTATAISIDDLIPALDIPGRKIIMLDTCQSGGVDNNRLVHNLRNRSTVIFTASQEDQDARESSSYNGGHFTSGIINGLNGEAAEDGLVLIKNLADFVIKQLKRIDRRQEPVTMVPDGYKEFVISVVE